MLHPQLTLNGQDTAIHPVSLVRPACDLTGEGAGQAAGVEGGRCERLPWHLVAACQCWDVPE